MNVGAVNGYASVPYVSPYSSMAAGRQTTNAEQAQMAQQAVQTAGTNQLKNEQQIDKSKLPKNDPNYECQTCDNRKYQDGSDEADVSFKFASKVAPEAAASAVRSHEQMHVKNAYQKAEKDNGKVISASVSIHTSICPECGRTYVSGGTTRTQIKYTNEENPYQQDLKTQQGSLLRGANIDMTA